MTTNRKQWSELNPTGELRNFRFVDGIVYGTVYKDLSETLQVNRDVLFEAFTLVDYEDHYFIITGSFATKKYWLAQKKYERKILSE